MNKIYYDVDKNIEIVDISGMKTLEQINQEFKGDFKDVTAKKEAKAEEDKLKVQEEARLRADIRKNAINKLKALGLTEEEINTL